MRVRPTHHPTRRLVPVTIRSTAAAAALAAVALPLSAQSANWQPLGTLTGASPAVVAPVDPNLPQYRVGAGDTRFNGVVRIIMNRTDGTFVCSGSVLNNGNRQVILSAAHCFTNALGANNTTSVTVEYRSAQTGALIQSRTTAGSNVFIRSGYNGSVVNQRDVAVINLGIGNGFTDATIRGYDLFQGASFAGTTVNLAGYGATGNGITGAVGGAQTWMRWGQNRFETSCGNAVSVASCAGTRAGNPSNNVNTQGGVIIGDFDDPTNAIPNNDSQLCFFTNICTGAVGGTPGEVNIGGGDSGSAAFIASSQEILGVASFGSRRIDITPIPPFGAFNTSFGYACVANITGNAECQGNFAFVNSVLAAAVIPEPSTYALMATGLVGLAGVARRRNKKS